MQPHMLQFCLERDSQIDRKPFLCSSVLAAHLGPHGRIFISWAHNEIINILSLAPLGGVIKKLLAVMFANGGPPAVGCKIEQFPCSVSSVSNRPVVFLGGPGKILVRIASAACFTRFFGSAPCPVRKQWVNQSSALLTTLLT